MPDTITPNYSLVKPQVTGSPDTWGNKINADLDIIDDVLKSAETLAKDSMQRSGTIAERTADELLFYKDALDPLAEADDDVLMDRGAVRTLAASLINALMPIGTIIMWGGTVATIPAGWALCNGQTVNGVMTPNMMDRFPMQTGSSGFPPGAMGGTNTLSVSTRTSGTALAWEHMPAHNHAVYDPGHSHSVTEATPVGTTDGAVIAGGYQIAVQMHARVSSLEGTGIQTYNAGSGWAHDHAYAFAIPYAQYWPQYYVVCFIMKVALA